MTEWIFDKKSREGTLCWSADLTIGEVARFKQAMQQALDEAEQVTLNLEDVSSIDVAGLQIIYACHRYAETHDKQLYLQTGDNPEFPRTAEETGFAQWATRSFGDVPAGVGMRRV